MSYAVVCFLEESGDLSEVVQEVPLTWLRENNTICMWPPTNTSHHIINKTPPMGTWKRCRVRCDKICDTLLEARRRCNNDVSSEDERGRGQRKKFLSKHLTGHKVLCPSPPLPDDDCYDEDYRLEEIGVTQQPAGDIPLTSIGYQFDKPNYENIPHKQTRVGQTHEQLSIGQADDPQFSQGISKPNYQNIPHKQTTIGQTHEQLSIGQTDDPQFSQGISIGNDSQAILFENQGNRLGAIENKLDKIVTMLGSIMVELETARTNLQPVTYYHRGKFPFASIEDIIKFNEILDADLKNKLELTKYFASIGGLSAKDFHARAMSKIMTNTLAMTCSWKGLKNNYKIGHFQLWTCLYDAIYQQFPITLKEFEILTKDWLRHAKQRHTRQAV